MSGYVGYAVGYILLLIQGQLFVLLWIFLHFIRNQSYNLHLGLPYAHIGLLSLLRGFLDVLLLLFFCSALGFLLSFSFALLYLQSERFECFTGGAVELFLQVAHDGLQRIDFIVERFYLRIFLGK